MVSDINGNKVDDRIAAMIFKKHTLKKSDFLEERILRQEHRMFRLDNLRLIKMCDLEVYDGHMKKMAYPDLYR